MAHGACHMHMSDGRVRTMYMHMYASLYMHMYMHMQEALADWYTSLT